KDKLILYTRDHGKLDDYLYFKYLRTRCKELSCQLYNAYLSEVNNNILNNPKFFWKFIRDRRTSAGDLSDEMFLGNKSAKGGVQVANLFAEFLSSVYFVDYCY